MVLALIVIQIVKMDKIKINWIKKYKEIMSKKE
jgi:hypothetical protein